MATNAHVVFVRGLSPEEHRMLSALAANSPARTLNGFMLEVIRELLGGRRPQARLPRPGRDFARQLATWNSPEHGAAAPPRYDEPAGRPEPPCPT